MRLLIFAVATMIVGGCASTPPNAFNVAPSTKPIDASYIVVKKDLRFLPSLSGYLLPSGMYLPTSRNEHGVYYQSPKGITALGPLGGPHYPMGGIYRFKRKDGSIGLQVWHKTAQGGITTRELNSMIGANLEKNLAYHE